MAIGEQCWDWVTSDDEYDALCEIVGDMTSASLLSVPGVHDALREHLNNEVLEYLAEQNYRRPRCGHPMNEDGGCSCWEG